MTNQTEIMKILDKSLGRGVAIQFYDGRAVNAQLRGISFKAGEGVYYANVIDDEGYHDSYNVLTIEGVKPNGK